MIPGGNYETAITDVALGPRFWIFPVGITLFLADLACGGIMHKMKDILETKRGVLDETAQHCK